MRVIIAGSRSLTDFQLVAAAMAAAHFPVTEVVSGGAAGIDSLGERWASEHNIPVRRFPADWEAHGKKAGYLRNAEMALYADALVLVWDGVSAGSRSMLALATARNLAVHVHRVRDSGLTIRGRSYIRADMSDSPKKDTALDRVRFVLPLFKLRIDMAKLENPDAEVMFGVLCVNKDGTGRVVVRIPETKEFLTDLAEVAGVKDNMGWFPEEELDRETPK